MLKREQQEENNVNSLKIQLKAAIKSKHCLDDMIEKLLQNVLHTNTLYYL